MLIYTLYLYQCFVPFCTECGTRYIQLKAVLEKNILSVSNHSVPSGTLSTYIYNCTECSINPEC
jgi:hypothetical protein